MRRWLVVVLTGALSAALPASASASAGGCRVDVPGAEKSVSVCLDDLTTTGTVASGHTVAADWAGLTSAGLPTYGSVPGVQVDGYFPDTSTANTNNGWNHDSQFVLRLPAHWNGGLVVSGSPGVRRQYANDRAIGDQALAEGYAFAATDKGNTGAAFYEDGVRPGDALAEWNTRVTQLTLAARAAAVAQRYGRPASRTLAAGLSNGGYLVRWQLENRPWLYDGGVDWEGTLWRADGPNLFTFLPPALRAYPAYAAGSPRSAPVHFGRRVRAGVGVPVGLPLPRLLGPDPADLPRGGRPVVRRRARRPGPRSAPRGRRRATPTTTTRPGPLRWPARWSGSR